KRRGKRKAEERDATRGRRSGGKEEGRVEAVGMGWNESEWKRRERRKGEKHRERREEKRGATGKKEEERGRRRERKKERGGEGGKKTARPGRGIVFCPKSGILTHGGNERGPSVRT
ncbi:hypothetical protein, partial [Devosia limi]|uniref:hypothetical protein n=1 Tax=Devosia limi TaxID=288995 RepID=UPI001AEC2114